MKILELTLFTEGIDGVWTRVKEEAQRLSKNGHEVKIFSSDFVKGDEKGKRAKSREKLGKIEIIRFPARKLGGESFMNWDFEGEAMRFEPDVIIAHSYRHMHTVQALKISKRLGAKIFLVTHAPFVAGDGTRDLKSKIGVRIYDFFIGPMTLNKFDKVIAITKWELPYLRKLGVEERRIEYIPNGIPEEFFKTRKNKKENKILFLGRISPIKDIETLIRAIGLLKDKKIKLEIVGPSEGNYLAKLKDLVDKLGLRNRIIFLPPIYDIKEKIRKVDSCRIFVLSSKREAMPQSLIEAMAREKIVIGSHNLGVIDLVDDGKNGFIFRIGDARDLAEKIDLVLNKKNYETKKIAENAKKSVEQFSWDKIIKKMERLLS